MKKLLVTCDCGQQLQVPRSALGKIGVCPSCGQSSRITANNTSPLRRGGGAPQQSYVRRSSGLNTGATPPENARERFGRAVDCFYAGRYAEALAIFDHLATEYPDNPDIEQGRNECIAAMRRPPRALPEAKPGSNLLTHGELDEETVKRVVLEKLLGGSTEQIQLEAARIAADILGMVPGKRADEESATDVTQTASDNSENVEEEPASQSFEHHDSDNSNLDHGENGKTRHEPGITEEQSAADEATNWRSEEVPRS